MESEVYAINTMIQPENQQENIIEFEALRDTTKLLQDYPDILQVKDLQNILHIGRNRIYELLETNKIHSFRIGNRHKIPKMYLINYIINS